MSSAGTNPDRTLSNGVQHRLNIRWRAGDDAEDLARRHLLIQGFLQFVEQPNIFDGNDSLVGKGLKQSDLRRGEGAHLFCGVHSVFQ